MQNTSERWIDWRAPAAEIVQRLGISVRGMGAEPRAKACIGGQTIEVLWGETGGTVSVYPPGTLTRCDQQVWVQTGRGHLMLQTIRVDGKSCDAATWFVENGYSAGDMLDLVTDDRDHGPGREFSHAA